MIFRPVTLFALGLRIFSALIIGGAGFVGKHLARQLHEDGYTVAVTCLSALVTATIPPSVGLILFGYVGGVSIGRLFMAGIVPGVLMAAALMTTVALTARKRGYEPPTSQVEPLNKAEVLQTLKESWPAIMFPIILLVGIRLGIFTPSEAGAFAVVYKRNDGGYGVIEDTE